MANIISSKIADLIVRFPPFDKLEKEELNKLSEEAEVLYFKAGETVFKQKEKAQPFIFFLKEGQVLLRETDGQEKKLVDICDEGELFGVRAMLTGNPYVFEAYCEEESLVYAFPLSIFKPIVDANNQVSLFFAAGLASGQKGAPQHTISSHNYRNTGSDLLSWQKPLNEFKESLILINSSASIQSASQKMTTHSANCAVITDEKQRAVGIITDTDLRVKVVSTALSVQESVSKIMSTDLVTKEKGLPLAEYIISMMKHNIKHLIITEKEKVIGIFSQETLFSQLRSNPFAIIYSLESSENVEQLCYHRNKVDQFLQYYLEQNIKTSVVSQLITTINDSLIKRAIQLAISDMESEKYYKPKVAFAFISLGSEGREEQLLRTDQDNAIIFENVDAAAINYTREYFTQLGRKVNKILFESGFDYCPADMMAGNPNWCLTLSEWKNRFSGWIHSPEKEALLMSTIFFDYRYIYGKQKLTKELDQFLQKEISSNKIFLNFLAKNATKNPAPLSFFKNLIVERSGKHEKEFDLKARAMMPLTDIARVLCLEAGNVNNKNTIERYLFLAENDNSRKELYMQAAQAYEFLSQFRAIEGMRNQDSGRFIPINEITKFDRQLLRNSFEPIYDLQQMIELRFQLNYFS
ncbi:DUF294 nucleotidyltransferase-like domain-containing protein [Marivirga arenosa]|uniref:DUF294 nucleotidyltransferase-like domain-containing protein n=1 Tax=Marivirga arenosa TaxID=3059076 RepID=A0AA51NA33_9BACT|nr:DUF294 nucleotidyltransferase-like domain-containing protein [Marivirga sp. ABR2-2]WMN07290.1 DUF294 nucleotidyltransferase-like domain-containing protein [Marivirga sp. ABR2-2]